MVYSVYIYRLYPAFHYDNLRAERRNYTTVSSFHIEELNNCKLTKIEISKKVGVSPEMITQYITTKKLPKLDTFAKLCKELDLSANYILGLSDH